MAQFQTFCETWAASPLFQPPLLCASEKPYLRQSQTVNKTELLP